MIFKKKSIKPCSRLHLKLLQYVFDGGSLEELAKTIELNFLTPKSSEMAVCSIFRHLVSVYNNPQNSGTAILRFNVDAALALDKTETVTDSSQKDELQKVAKREVLQQLLNKRTILYLTEHGYGSARKLGLATTDDSELDIVLDLLHRF